MSKCLLRAPPAAPDIGASSIGADGFLVAHEVRLWQMLAELTERRPSGSGAAMAVRPPRRASLSLLGGFELTVDGEKVTLPMPAQRLLAFVALGDRPMLRTYVAETLWLESSEERASGSLRSALWRLRRPGLELVDASSRQLCLASDVVLDVRVLERWAHEALELRDEFGNVPAYISEVSNAITGDLLPDWYDDWLMVERERLRELRVRALERVCERHTRAGRFREAIETGFAAVNAEPLRESAHRCLVRVYLAEGNQAEALRSYGVYRNLLHEQLGLEPSPRMEALVARLPQP